MAWHRNRENQFKIGEDVLAAGVYSWSESASYTTDEQEYYDGDGSTEMDVSAVSRDFTFQCHKKDGDAAASKVWGMRNATGEALPVEFTWTDVDGAAEVWDATIHDIVATGGSAGDKNGFQFQVHKNRIKSTTPAS